MKSNRDRLIEAALEAVKHRGLKDLTFNDIGHKAGVLPAHVYYYFPDKSDLAQALIERHTHSMIETMSRISSQALPLQEKINQFIAIFEDLARRNQGSLSTLLATDNESCDQRTLQSISALFQRTELWLYHLLEQHREEIKSSLTSEHLANVIVSSLEGALAIDRMTKTRSNLRAQRRFLLSLL